MGRKAGKIVRRGEGWNQMHGFGNKKAKNNSSMTVKQEKTSNSKKDGREKKKGGTRENEWQTHLCP